MSISQPLAPPLEPDALRHVPGVLGEISRERARDYHGAAWQLELNSPSARPSFQQALATAELAIIAEVKRSSPSQGAIAPIVPSEAAQAYQRGGAAALSVLTEMRHFGGALEHLEQVAAVSSLPILRKDFTVHPLQLYEAKAAGASAVLLIVAVLGEHTAAYLQLAQTLGLDALVEVHDSAELQCALTAGAQLIGVNNRDLRTLEIDLSNAPRLIAEARAEGFSGTLVAESGYKQAEELQALQGLADAVLIGTSLVGSGKLEQALQQLRSELSS